jgi:ubiquinone/menaquinone biosynthesis C-methylase UbiE
MFHPRGPSLTELAKQALSSTDEGYDLLAPKFDLTPFRTPDPVLEIVAAQVARGGAVRSALDLCCGTGAAMRWIRPLCSEQIVGVDRSAGMLLEARRRLSDDAGQAPQRLIRADALALPLSRSFDLVTCFGAFGHIRAADEGRLVAQVARVLLPGGRFVFVTSELAPLTSTSRWAAHAFNAAMRVRNALIKPEFVMYYLTFLLPRCRELLEARGFEVQVERDLFPAPYSRAILVTATARP